MSKEQIDMQWAMWRIQRKQSWPLAAMLVVMGACMVPPPVTPAECGDGVVDEIAGEQCDEGDENGEDTASCNRDCTIPFCGDGYTKPAAGEECDDANAVSGDGCSATCLREGCDDGVQDPGCEPPRCGDAEVDPGEACDEGGVDTRLCNQDCTAWVCGDGYVNRAAGEDCDTGGDSPACDNDCTPAACGDGLVNPAAGEECDGADLDDGGECLTTCKLARCDDGVRNGGEEDVDCGGPCEACWSGAGQQLVTGRDHTCALTRAGAVRCWGLGTYGRLGYGNLDTIGDDEIAADASDVDVGAQVAQIAAGAEHTCALLSAGAVRCWGRGAYGRLGYGNTSNIGDELGETPATAGDVDVDGHVTQLALGEDHTCALLSTGKVRCWGAGGYGQLGYESASNIGDDPGETPRTAGDVEVGGHVVQIAAGVFHTCALLDTGAVRCWGKSDYGQLGYGRKDNHGDDPGETPAAAGDVDVGGYVVQLAAGGYHTCALLDTGVVRCWGRNSYGQLGRGHRDHVGDDPGETPAPAADVSADVAIGGGVARLAAGGHHTCALLSTGAVQCWGLGDEGQLGYGDVDDISDDPGESPALAGDVDVGGLVVQLAAGRRHTCARLVTGAVRCWGTGMQGQLGYGVDDKRHIGDDELPSWAGDVPFH